MAPPTKFTPKQVDEGLLAMAEYGGSPTRAAEVVSFEVSANTLSTWKRTQHAERYVELAVKHGEELEARAVVLARENALAAAEAERTLIERNAKIQAPELVPQALRAAADSKSKNIDKLLALTGRPVAPKDTSAQAGMRLLDEMVKRGYLRMNVELPEPPVEGTASEEVQSAALDGEPGRDADVHGTTASRPSGGGRPLPAGSAGA